MSSKWVFTLMTVRPIKKQTYPEKNRILCGAKCIEKGQPCDGGSSRDG